YGCLVELKNKLPQDLTLKNSLTHSLDELTVKKSRYVNFAKTSYKVVSPARKLFSVTNGFEVSPEIPVEVKLKKNCKTKNTYFCLYFSIKDGNSQILNFDFKNEKNKNHISHWANLVWELDNTKDNISLKLINFEDNLHVFENN
ncbi:MAG: hypothetical protein Q7U04_13370, partial [Bacteriovorax sp.]|nr:hypothetical protein [Bacteriovorax sp.]